MKHYSLLCEVFQTTDYTGVVLYKLELVPRYLEFNMSMSSNASSKRTVFVGGLAEEADEKVLHAAFIPFGDLVDIQIPLDYETEKHRGFAFIEFESAEDASAAIDNMVCF